MGLYKGEGKACIQGAYIWNGLSISKHGQLIFGRGAYIWGGAYIRGGGGQSRRFMVSSRVKYFYCKVTHLPFYNVIGAHGSVIDLSILFCKK